MRYRLMATYRGEAYEAGIGPADADVVLYAACPPPEELGFEPATGYWRKQVVRAELDGLWESRPVGIFRGEQCIVLDDLGDRLHIAYLGQDADRAAQQGYWQVDRGVFELLAPREDVTGLTEERVEKPLYPSAAPMPAPVPPYAYEGMPGNGQQDAPGGVPGASALAPQYGPPVGGPDLAPQFALPPHPGAQDLAPQFALPYPNPPYPGAPHPGGQDMQPQFAVPYPEAPDRDASGRAARRERVATRDVFCELADLAAIPRTAYALEAEVDGSICLLTTPDGFEVFLAAEGARHEVRSFNDEESAYFYLFGVLVAEAIRNGALARANGARAGYGPPGR